MSEADTDFLVDQSPKIVDAASLNGCPVRILGGIGVELQAADKPEISTRFSRNPKDIANNLSKKNARTIERTLVQMKYRPDERFNLFHGHSREIWYAGTYQIDVFFDKLEMCHTIDLRKRLDLDGPALNVSDLLLSKLQIVRINEKDIIDSIILLLEHDLEGKKIGIDMKYVCSLLSHDWGFYHTVEINLARLRNFVINDKRVREDERKIILEKINSIEESLEASDRSYTWKIRSLIGEKKKWYNEVEEVIR